MSHVSPSPTPADWARLAQALVDMRDALVEVALTLRDHQMTLDTPERHVALLQVRTIIEQAKADQSRTGRGR
ncbi:MAG: hypothetical protein WCH60_17375 [Burkholderiales bacterium]|jgi:hypothetical protein